MQKIMLHVRMMRIVESTLQKLREQRHEDAISQHYTFVKLPKDAHPSLFKEFTYNISKLQ